jgi:A/G-specific adenine glycosylase
VIPIDAAAASGLRDAVLGWYRANGRPLAFRRTSDPWAILVSEFMAQQTQAARAAEAWERFLGAYPTPASLAAATPADALRAWRGLGYNRRALALRAAAIRIVEDHGGAVPSSLAELDALPGVGPYTARALAALAYGRPVGAVDTNVRRVLSRALFAAPPSERDLQLAADEIVPADRPGEWTHALMDVGATFCRPRNPRCDACPARASCLYAARVATEPAAAIAPERPIRLRGRTPQPAFESTSRWLRGRILDQLRDAPAGSWVELGEAPIGGHDARGIASALATLARDGLVELRPDAPVSARLPLA